MVYTLDEAENILGRLLPVLEERMEKWAEVHYLRIEGGAEEFSGSDYLTVVEVIGTGSVTNLYEWEMYRLYIE